MNLLKASPRWIRLIPSDGGHKVPNRKGLIVLGGAIKHVTGTSSFLNIVVVPSLTPETQHLIPITSQSAATVSASYPIFTNESSISQSHWSPIILTEGFILSFGGDATADAVVCILEFDL